MSGWTSTQTPSPLAPGRLAATSSLWYSGKMSTVTVRVSVRMTMWKQQRYWVVSCRSSLVAPSPLMFQDMMLIPSWLPIPHAAPVAG